MFRFLLWVASRWMLVLVQPIGLVWLALLALTAGLWIKRHLRFACGAGAIALFVLVIGGSDFPALLLRSLERPYWNSSREVLPVCDAVVLLGGGVTPSRTEVASLHLTLAGDRPFAGLELMRLGKAPVLCLGGAGQVIEGKIAVESELLKAAISERHLMGGEIVALAPCVDTHEEAVRVRALAAERGWKRVLLVTSAWHMHRAVATFRTAGLNVVPAPCNFVTDPRTPLKFYKLRPPGYEGFEQMALWTHEQIGWLEYRRRGWIDPSKVGDLTARERE